MLFRSRAYPANAEAHLRAEPARSAPKKRGNQSRRGVGTAELGLPASFNLADLAIDLAYHYRCAFPDLVGADSRYSFAQCLVLHDRIPRHLKLTNPFIGDEREERSTQSAPREDVVHQLDRPGVYVQSVDDLPEHLRLTLGHLLE